MIIDFHKCYGGGGSGSGVTPQEVQAQIDSALTPYWDSAATESAITQSVSGKADASNVSANTEDYVFPAWNEDGVVTGEVSEAYQNVIKLNDYPLYVYGLNRDNLDIWALDRKGTAGQIVVADSDGTPVWSAVTMPDMTAYTPTSGFSTINGSAITNGGNIVIQGGGDMSGYYTSAQTDEKIASAVTPVANHLAEVEEITASAYTELHDDILALSARTPDMSAYTPTSGFATVNGSAITNGGNIVIQGGGGGDMSNYWNSAETKSYVDSATTNLQDQIDTMDEVVSAALVDLEGKKVESQDVKHIVKLTQAQYDALVNKDPYTFYIIVSN